MSDTWLYAAEGFALAALVGLTLVLLTAQLIARQNKGLNLRLPLLVAWGARLISAIAVHLTSFGSQIRGPDDHGYWVTAHLLASGDPVGGSWHKTFLHQFFEFVIAGEVKVFHASDLAVRSSQVTLTVLGLGLIAGAAGQLGGKRAAYITAWLLALEPANVFFSTLLSKEPMIFFAEGLVIYGGSLLWRRVRLLPLMMMALGCLLAIGTRSYAGWFLIGATAIVGLHASVLRASLAARRAVAAVVLLAGAIAISTPAVINAASRQELSSLNYSQSANASDNSNLKLEPVDFSSRAAVVRNLPQRIFDVTFRPYPWQVGSMSQRLGVLETLAVLAIVVMIVRMIIRQRSGILRRAGPIVYPAVLSLVAYSLSSGNAGTSFRYRTHVVAMAIALIVVLRQPATDVARRSLKASEAGAIPLGREPVATPG